MTDMKSHIERAEYTKRQMNAVWEVMTARFEHHIAALQVVAGETKQAVADISDRLAALERIKADELIAEYGSDGPPRPDPHDGGYGAGELATKPAKRKKWGDWNYTSAPDNCEVIATFIDGCIVRWRARL